MFDKLKDINLFTLFLARNSCSGINESSVLNFLACGSSSNGLLAGCFIPIFKKLKYIKLKYKAIND